MKAGFCTVSLLGAVGMNMAGFEERNHGNIGVNDPVEEKIMVLEINNQYFAFGVGDYIGIKLPSSKYIKKEVNRLTNIPIDNIMLSATHTHSSYKAAGIDDERKNLGLDLDYDYSDIDRVYHKLMLEKIIGGFVYAFNNLQDAKFGYGIGSIDDFGTNRNNPNGYYDNSVHVLKISDLNDNIIGVLAQFSCHPTILNHENYFISADYPGYFRRQIEKIYKGSTCIFMQGASGEVSSRFTRRGNDYKEVIRLGNILVGEVLKLLSVIEESENFSLKCFTEEICLKIKKFEEDDILDKNIEINENKLKKMIEENVSQKEIRKQYVTLQGHQRTRKQKNIIKASEVNSVIQIVKLGKFNIVGFPGEAFGEIGRDAKNILGNNTMICGYCNDYLGYLISNEGYKGKGYEKEMTLFDYNLHDSIIEIVKNVENNI